MGGTATTIGQTGLAAIRPRGTLASGRWLDRQFTRFAVLPTALLMIGVYGIPLLFSGMLSFQGWAPSAGLFGGHFIGTGNYEDLLTDPDFLDAIRVTFQFTALTVSAELAAGLGIALLLNIDLPYIAVFRTLLIVPMMITPVVASLCWKLLLDPDYGVINYWIGQHIVFLGRPDTAL
jgi:multiple sugar transport system permease protein